jgi:DNA-binding phage protein
MMPALLATALGNITRSKGMASAVVDASIAREALCKALEPSSHQRFDPCRL